MTVRFTTAAGQEITVAVPPRKHTAPGDQVELGYNPDNPSEVTTDLRSKFMAIAEPICLLAAIVFFNVLAWKYTEPFSPPRRESLEVPPFPKAGDETGVGPEVPAPEWPDDQPKRPEM